MHFFNLFNIITSVIIILILDVLLSSIISCSCKLERCTKSVTLPLCTTFMYMEKQINVRTSLIHIVTTYTLHITHCSVEFLHFVNSQSRSFFKGAPARTVYRVYRKGIFLNIYSLVILSFFVCGLSVTLSPIQGKVMYIAVCYSE